MALELSPILSGISDIGNTALSIGNWFYNRDMLQKQWEREDTAVQRRAADLSAAGLSKTLAAGSAATSTYSASSAPSVSNQTASALLDMQRLQKDIVQADANIDYTNAQTELLKSQIDFMKNTGIDPNERNPIMALVKFLGGYGQKPDGSNSSNVDSSNKDFSDKVLDNIDKGFSTVFKKVLPGVGNVVDQTLLNSPLLFNSKKSMPEISDDKKKLYDYYAPSAYGYINKYYNLGRRHR